MAQAKTFWLDVGRPGTRATVRQGVEHAISGKRAIIVHRDDNNAVEIRPQRDGTYDVTIYRSGKQHHAVKARTDEELLHLARRAFGEEGRSDRPPRTRKNPRYPGLRRPAWDGPGVLERDPHDGTPYRFKTRKDAEAYAAAQAFRNHRRVYVHRTSRGGGGYEVSSGPHTGEYGQAVSVALTNGEIVVNRGRDFGNRSNPAVYAVTLDGRVVSGTETHNRTHAWKWADRLTKQTGLKHSVGLKVGHRKIGPRPKGRLNPRRNPGSGSSDRIASFRRIVKNWQAEKVDGVLVDAFSASAIVQVYDALSETNRMKFLALPAHKMAIVAFKVLKA